MNFNFAVDLQCLSELYGAQVLLINHGCLYNVSYGSSCILQYFHNKKKVSLVNAHAFGFHVKRKDNLNQYIRGILVIYSVSDVWTSNKHWG